MASSLNPPRLILGYRKGCLTAYGEVSQASSCTPEFLEVDISWWSSILSRGACGRAYQLITRLGLLGPRGCPPGPWEVTCPIVDSNLMDFGIIYLTQLCSFLIPAIVQK